MFILRSKILAFLLTSTISSIFVHIFVNSELQENETSATEPFPKEKCESLLVNCSCYDYEIVAGLFCREMDDFSKVSHFLSSDLIFKKNTTYEITFSEIKYLPAGILKGLIVYRLFLDDPEMTAIDENAFQGVIRLRRFHVWHSKITIVPDFRIIKDSIRSIKIDSSRLTSLDGNDLQDLPLVTRLSFANNSIQYIHPDAFKGTENVKLFDISRNKLRFIPPNLLDPWKQLNKFVVSYNNLLHVNQLFAVTHPKFIYLDNNNITDVDTVLHYNMTKVETVILSGNPIENISLNAFNKKVPNVRFLYLDHCGIRQIKESHFKSLSILATLDLSFNLIEEVQLQTIQFGKDMELVLIGNQIRKFDAELSYTVKRLYMEQNQLQSLNRTLQFTQIAEVSVARNQIGYLTNEDLRGVHATANLELQGNKIRWIDRLTFLSIRNELHYLDMSSNFISSLNGSVMYLSQLKLLNLTDNFIQTFDRGEFTGLNELSELYLEDNQIVALSGQLHQLPQLQYLVVTQNNIETLVPEQIPKQLRYIYLTGNPFKCDCRLLPFLLWLKTNNSPSTDIDLCLSPDVVSNKRLQERTTCPEMCSCECTKEETKVPFLSMNCSSKNLTMVPPVLTSNFMQIQDNGSVTFDLSRSLVLPQNAYPSLYIHDYVLGIDLENNLLESLETAHMPPGLVHLYLSHNKLRQLPENMMYTLRNLKRVSLSENPWQCDCKALQFRKWILSNSDIVQDTNTTRCGIHHNGDSTLNGKLIWTLTDLDLCPTDIGMIISGAIGILVFLLLCLTAMILYTRYNLNMRVFLYSHGITWVKRKDLDHDKIFDAFISFSHKDEEFVTREIISVIEGKDRNIRLCIHYRHFRPGEFIHDNIIYAVQNSKRTVLILSRNFLESEWCLMEFRAAHVQALEDRVHRIIVVKVGDLPKEIDPSIKVYLDSTTFLTWGEKYFWNNLLYVLPTANNERNNHQNKIKLKEIKHGENYFNKGLF